MLNKRVHSMEGKGPKNVGETTWIQILMSPTISHVTSGQYPNNSVPQFPHL